MPRESAKVRCFCFCNFRHCRRILATFCTCALMHSHFCIQISSRSLAQFPQVCTYMLLTSTVSYSVFSTWDLIPDSCHLRIYPCTQRILGLSIRLSNFLAFSNKLIRSCRTSQRSCQPRTSDFVSIFCHQDIQKTTI